jgi:hypothetical protein
MTWIVAIALIVYLAERGYRILIPKGQRVSIEEWKKQHHIGVDLTEVKPIENIVSAPDVQQAQQAQLQSYKKFAPLLAIFALILISVGFIRALKSLAWKQEVFALRVKSCA